MGQSVTLQYCSPCCLEHKTCIKCSPMENPHIGIRKAWCWHSWWSTSHFLHRTTHAAVSSFSGAEQSSALHWCKFGVTTLWSSEINPWWVTDSLGFPYLTAVTCLLKCNLNPSLMENEFLYQASNLESVSPWPSGLGDYFTLPDLWHYL